MEVIFCLFPDPLLGDPGTLSLSPHAPHLTLSHSDENVALPQDTAEVKRKTINMFACSIHKAYRSVVDYYAATITQNVTEAYNRIKC